MAGAHTATPWHVESDVRIYAVSDGAHVASVWTRHVSDAREDGESWLDMRHRTQPQRDAVIIEERANAAFIVTACNAHDQLVAALKMLLDDMDVLENLTKAQLTQAFAALAMGSVK